MCIRKKKAQTNTFVCIYVCVFLIIKQNANNNNNNNNKQIITAIFLEDHPNADKLPEDEHVLLSDGGRHIYTQQ